MIPFLRSSPALRLLAFITLATCPTYSRADVLIGVPGSFAHNFGAWHLDLQNGLQAEVFPDTTSISGPAIRVHVPVAGEKRYFVQLVCKGVVFLEGKTYHLHFEAKSAPAADLSVLAASYHEKFEELWRKDHVATSSDWEDYDFDIQPKATEAEGQLIFGGLSAQAGDYWFANVTVIEEK